MKSFLAGICIFISVASFLKNEEAKRMDQLGTTYTFESVQNYEVLPIQNKNIANRFFQKVSNISEEAAETNAIILVKASNNSNSNENSYFAVPLEDNQNIQGLIEQYNQQNQIEKTEQVINESPLAFID